MIAPILAAWQRPTTHLQAQDGLQPADARLREHPTYSAGLESVYTAPFFLALDAGFFMWRDALWPLSPAVQLLGAVIRQ
jgi:hypothetical protein